MHYTLEAILQGNDKVLGYYEAAKGKWEELFAGEADAKSWAEWIVGETKTFETEAGGAFLGHEVMAWSGFGLLYSNQFGWQDAERKTADTLVAAFAAADVGDDIKEAARKAAASYGLGEEPSA